MVRGLRRLDAALSKAPQKDLDQPGSRQSPAAEEISRKERKEMKGGNEATSGSGITQFAEGEPNV
ncbi:MAG: hypothetical protein IJQ39_12245 [Thermoguttaceae bacterium]|nr:hypothetical protein [Thermoguttaceae bacterium]